MKNNDRTHLSYEIEGEGRVDLYLLTPGISLSFNQIRTGSWTKGDDSAFSEKMLVFNFCVGGRCDVSLAQNRYAIVKEHQICISTILPTKNFYYPGSRYDGVQIHIDRMALKKENGNDFLTQMGIDPERIANRFCSRNGLYLHRMSESLLHLMEDAWKQKEQPEPGILRYLTVRMLHEVLGLPQESEPESYFTRGQIAIVKEAEAIIMSDLSKRIPAREMAARFGISESSFKLYVKGILGDSYLSYFRRKRMERAAELLENTSLKVIEIASTVGYENQGKFAKVFADYSGVSPKEFRRRMKNKMMQENYL